MSHHRKQLESDKDINAVLRFMMEASYYIDLYKDQELQRS